MKELYWNGCYARQWTGEIVPDAFAHPAKFRRGLIERIYEYAIEQGYISSGDTVGDPFGGVALGAWPALRRGINWIGVELEEKFVSFGKANLELWGEKWAAHFHWGNGQLVQGDSRQFAAIVRGCEVVVSSPPYAGILKGDRNGIDWSKVKDGGTNETKGRHAVGTEYGQEEGQLGAMPEGDLQAIVSSSSFEMRDPNGHSTDRELLLIVLRGGVFPNPKERLQAIVSSPPFGTAETRNRTPHNGGHVADMMTRAYTQDKQGVTEGNLAQMTTNDGELAAIVSSPPFADSIGSDNPAKRGGLFRDPKRANDKNLTGTYGNSEGQLGAMSDVGDLNAVVSSPPYEQSLSHKTGGQEGVESTGNGGTIHPRNYSRIAENLGNQQGATFWSASRQIVTECHKALVQGGMSIWVVKHYVKNHELVDFPGQWRTLCEACGFELVEVARAWVKTPEWIQDDLFGGETVDQKSYKSFFRRLAEKKGAPVIDFETVLFMRRV